MVWNVKTARGESFPPTPEPRRLILLRYPLTGTSGLLNLREGAAGHVVDDAKLSYRANVTVATVPSELVYVQVTVICFRSNLFGCASGQECRRR